MIKKILLVSYLLMTTLAFLPAQIVVDRNDMPNVGDTIRRSMVYGMNGNDYLTAGPGHVWDFSNLGWYSQQVESFVTVSSTPLVYQLVFNNPFDPNKATIASPQAGFDSLGGVTLQDIYEYYRETNASYSFLGMGVSVNGITIPIKYNSPDVWYKFPLTLSNTDSSTAVFSYSLAGYGYIYTSRHRVNLVDGWGTVITPFGSFSSIRVRSMVTEYDSIYLDTVATGYGISRNYTEYKWLGDNKGLPLIEIMEEGPAVTVHYLDSARAQLNASMPLTHQSCLQDSVQLQVNVTGGTPPYTYLWSTGDTTASLWASPNLPSVFSVTVTDVGGLSDPATTLVLVNPSPVVQVSADTSMYPGQFILLTSDATGGTPPYSYLWMPPNGLTSYNTPNPYASPSASTMYTLLVTDSLGCTGKDSVWVAVLPNTHTVNGMVSYNKPATYPLPNAEVLLMDAQGNLVLQTTSNTEGEFNLSGVPDGSYHLTAASTHPWGGGNATDAMKILKHFTGSTPLTGLNLEVADVDNSGYVNAVDALMVAKRFVGLISSFPSGDWIFENIIIEVSGQDLNQVLFGQCMGDVDASYNP